MTGSNIVISQLNKLLLSEKQAINQYSISLGFSENYGYKKLSKYISKRLDDEIEHSNELIERILFLEGIPEVNNIPDIKMDSNIEKQLLNDMASEITAIQDYTEAIQICCDEKDFGSRKLLEHILVEEEGHLKGIEERIEEINQMTIENWLSSQI